VLVPAYITACVQMLVCRCWCSLFAPARACACGVAKMSAWGRRRGRREEEEEEEEESYSGANAVNEDPERDRAEEASCRCSVSCIGTI
jgi:hypothetical protein